MQKEDLKAQGVYNRIPNALRAYLMDLNIADDYLSEEKIKKEQGYFEVKHELSSDQLARLKRGSEKCKDGRDFDGN